MKLKPFQLKFNPFQLIGSLTDEGTYHYLDPVESDWRFVLRYSDGIYLSHQSNDGSIIISYPSFSMLYNDSSFFIRCKSKRLNIKCALVFFLSELKDSCRLILENVVASEGIDFVISQCPIQFGINDIVYISTDFSPDISRVYNDLEIAL